MKEFKRTLLIFLGVVIGLTITLYIATKNDIILKETKATIHKLIKEQQDEIKSLTEKREQLTILLKTDQEVIDALFEEQERRSKYDSWINVSIGFLMGIIGSVIATFLYNMIRKRFKTKEAG